MTEFMQKQIVHGEWLEIETMNGTWFLPIEHAPKSAIDYCEEIPESEWDKKYPDGLPTQVKFDLQEWIDCFNLEDINSVEKISGFGCRLSAPGYLDCTEWTVFKTENEAKKHLSDMYDSE